MDDDFPTFIPGLELARRFYWEGVRPVLDTEFRGLRHSAALIGTGSEVLGFDTPCRPIITGDRAPCSSDRG